MSLFLHDKSGYLSMDTCCLIALSVSGHTESILRTIKPQCMLAEDVQSEIKSHNIQPLIEKGLLVRATLQTEEELAFVFFASQGLHNGEAACSAIAYRRGWGIATDEKKAVSVVTKVAPHVPFVTTPEIIKFWSEAANVARDDVRQVLIAIRTNANYEPSIKHPLNVWWNDFFSRV